MFIRLSALCLSALLLAGPASAQQRYPTVYGATGRPYGPTQANYQYERQYGQKWHGYGGSTTSYHPGHFHHHHHGGFGGYRPYGFYGGSYYNGISAFGPGFGISIGTPGYYGPYGAPYGYGPYGYSPYGLGTVAPYGLSANGNWGPVGALDTGPNYYRPPVLTPSAPALVPTPVAPGPVVVDNLGQPNGVLGPAPARIDPVTRIVPPSSPEAKLKSLDEQHLGDADLHRQNYANAYLHYKRAIQFAEDRPEAHARMGFCLAAMRRYDGAVSYLKRAIFLGPELAQVGETLSQIYGAENELAKMGVLSRVGDWVREDIRDPDRLFLLGVMLHFDQDPRARDVFQSGYQMAQGGEHFEAFLKVGSPAGNAAPIVGNGPNVTPLAPDVGNVPRSAPLPSALPRTPINAPRINPPQFNDNSVATPFPSSPVNPPSSDYTVIQPRSRANPINRQPPTTTNPLRSAPQPGRVNGGTPSDLPPLPSPESDSDFGPAPDSVPGPAYVPGSNVRPSLVPAPIPVPGPSTPPAATSPFPSTPSERPLETPPIPDPVEATPQLHESAETPTISGDSVSGPLLPLPSP